MRSRVDRCCVHDGIIGCSLEGISGCSLRGSVIKILRVYLGVTASLGEVLSR